MKLKLNRQIDCKASHLPTSTQVKQWVLATLKKVNFSEASTELTLRAVEPAESAELNEQYRAKKGPTNVLSFPDVPIPGIEAHYLGDLAICAELVIEEAKAQKITPEDHWAHLVIHGTLHLLGHDHIEEKDAELMEALEIEILGEFGIKNPY